MIAAFCEHHQKRVLLPLSAIEAFSLGPTSRSVRFRCHCGHLGTMTIPTLTSTRRTA